MSNVLNVKRISVLLYIKPNNRITNVNFDNQLGQAFYWFN
jgi:hypothetical protein